MKNNIQTIHQQMSSSVFAGFICCYNYKLNGVTVVQVVRMFVQLDGGPTVKQQIGHRCKEGSVEERTRYTHPCTH